VQVLTNAAVELGARAEQDAGSLALLTSVYAKKLCEADSASVFLTYNGHRVRALWDSPPPSSRTKWTRRVPHPVLIGHSVRVEEVHP